MPAQEPYVKVGGFLTIIHFNLMFLYAFYFPETLFTFLNSVRLGFKDLFK
jgi:hypothetical protein